MPGVPSGGVYANLLKHVSRLIQPGDTYSCGIDFGFKHDPMAIILIRSQQRVWNTIDVLAELYLIIEVGIPDKDWGLLLLIG
jgi:hypothetical protein